VSSRREGAGEATIHDSTGAFNTADGWRSDWRFLRAGDAATAAGEGGRSISSRAPLTSPPTTRSNPRDICKRTKNARLEYPVRCLGGQNRWSCLLPSAL